MRLNKTPRRLGPAGQPSRPRRTRGREPLRRQPGIEGACPAARRAPAADDARGCLGPRASDRAGRRADPPHRSADARLDDLLGPAGQRQDDGRAADRRRAAGRLRAGFGDPYWRSRTEEDLRCRPDTSRAWAGHASFRRRDPPLQPGAAGLFPPRHGGRRRHADRRDDGKPVVRAQRFALVAGARARLPALERRSDRSAVATRRAPPGKAAAALQGSARSPDRHGRRRRTGGADAGGGSVARRTARRGP